MELYQDFIKEAKALALGETKEFPIEILHRGTGEQWELTVRFLESKGFVVSAKTDKFPTGVYCAEGVDEDGCLKGWGIDDQKPTGLSVSHIGWPFLSRKPKAPQADKPGLKVVPHIVMALSFCRDGKWGKPLFVPHGCLSLLIADTTGIQYGQSAFEGACAMRNKSGEVFAFRLDRNAKRFDKSIRSLDLPGIDADLMRSVIEKIIAYNADYVPSKGKLYIRPSVTGLDGGLGIVVPQTSVIAVEVAAFGDYLPQSITIEALKYIQRPPSGTNKIAPNYGASFRIKHQVKSDGFHDYLSFDERGNVEEVSTCAVGFIDKKGRFVFPPVQDEIDTIPRHVLPSITRASVIEILKKSGEEVIIRDVSFEEVKEMKGIFTMGNAVGVLHVSRVCLKETPSEAGKVVEMDDEKIREKIFSIRDKIYRSRVGELEGFSHWAKRIC